MLQCEFKRLAPCSIIRAVSPKGGESMRKYEVMYVIRPDLEQDPTKEVIEKFKNVITDNGGEIEKHEEMGKRRLAYEIEGYNEGYYVLMNMSVDPTLILELERVFRITDSVIRYLVVKDEK